MNIRSLQGWALVVSGLIGLLAFVNSDNSVIKILFLIGAVLFILGVPAIQSVQPTGTPGLVGIILLELGALIALALNVMAMNGSGGFGDAVPFVGALAGALGRVVVGWLTTREKAFASWIGWAFIADGVLNFAGGLLGAGTVATVVNFLVPLVGAAALLGYGFGIARQKS